jgi:hypothetical protein
MNIDYAAPEFPLRHRGPETHTEFQDGDIQKALSGLLQNTTRHNSASLSVVGLWSGFKTSRDDARREKTSDPIAMEPSCFVICFIFITFPFRCFAPRAWKTYIRLPFADLFRETQMGERVCVVTCVCVHFPQGAFSQSNLYSARLEGNAMFSSLSSHVSFIKWIFRSRY